MGDVTTIMAEALVINRSDSRCGKCGRPAYPQQQAHLDEAGYGPRGKGCGVRWRYVTSDYVGTGIEEATRAMRPDLEWFNRWPKECSSGYCGWDPISGDPHTCPDKAGQHG